MSEPTVTVVKDADGNVRYYGVGSKELRDGLADGSLTPFEEAKPGEAKSPDSGEGGDTLEVDSGPGDGPADDRPADDRPDQGKAKPSRRS